MSVWVVLFETGCIDVVYFFSRGTGGAAGGGVVEDIFCFEWGNLEMGDSFCFFIGVISFWFFIGVIPL